MKNYAKVIGFILLLFFCSFQSNTLAEDSFSPGPGWQAIPAYGPELAILADWQDTASAGNTTDFGSLLGAPTESATNDMDNMSGATLTGNSTTGGMSNMGNGSTGGLGNMLGGLTGDNSILAISSIDKLKNMLTNVPGWGQLPELAEGAAFANTLCMKTITKGNRIDPSQVEPDTATLKFGGQTYALTPEEVEQWSKAPHNGDFLGLFGLPVDDNFSSPIILSPSMGIVTADFDPCKPGLETRYYSPLVIDVDTNGAIALDGGVIQFDIAPHIAGLETIPVPAPGKDMFLVWDKAGTETIEGAEREYKEGEIVDITELFGPEDYSRSDFSKLAYTDDGFTKLAKLCDVNKDGRVDKQDTTLSAEVAAKLKLWSPLSGELVLFKDTDIVVDVRSGSYERHPSDVEGWAVEYKMKDAQDNLVGYEWLTSKTGSLLCVDVLLAVQ